MNGTNEERLYNLLPALYRQRDRAAGETLRAMMSVLESQLKTLEADITACYNNWFVETCDAWVLPYLAELVGMPTLSQEKHTFSTQRRQVANTIGYRRHKGTIATLEHVLRDATGWPARVVETDRELAVTQHLGRVCREPQGTVDVRRTSAFVEPGGPFDGMARTAEVRRKPPGATFEALPSGRCSARGIGAFFWRLRDFCMTDSRPQQSMAIPTLLDFLNRAKSASEIFQRLVYESQPRSTDSSEKDQFLSLAEHILEERDLLPNRCFESLEQVADVVGGQESETSYMLMSFPRLYAFHPLGVDMPLFNWPQCITEIDQRAASLHMPLALSRAGLAADLEEYEARFGHRPEKSQPSNSRFYGPGRGINVAVWSDRRRRRKPISIPPIRVVSIDLSRWDTASARRVLNRYPTKQVAIDVELGRLAFLPNPEAFPETNPRRDEHIRVTYCYGFSTLMGGGPYHRRLARLLSPRTSFHIDVAKGAEGQSTAPEDRGQHTPVCVPTLKQALDLWHLHKEVGPRGVIHILDNGRYDEEVEIRLHKGAQLSIVADNGRRPTIGKNGLLAVVCEDEGAGAKRHLRLNGLLIHGGLQIGTPGSAEATGGLLVTLEHCTLVSSEDHRLKPALVRSEQAVQGLELSVERSILGPLYLPAATGNVRVRYSIVGNGSEYSIAADPTGTTPGPSVNLEHATIFGRVHARKVVASEVIFCSPVKAPAPETEDQIRHSYVPKGSSTLEGKPHPSILQDSAPPRFTSTRYGDPAYAQLSLDCPRAIRGGAADGSEMGAFHDLHQLVAEENLREVLEEYLPVGLHASIHYVT